MTKFLGQWYIALEVFVDPGLSKDTCIHLRLGIQFCLQLGTNLLGTARDLVVFSRPIFYHIAYECGTTQPSYIVPSSHKGLGFRIPQERSKPLCNKSPATICHSICTHLVDSPICWLCSNHFWLSQNPFVPMENLEVSHGVLK